MVYKLTIVQCNDDNHVPCSLWSLCISWYSSWFKSMVYKLTIVQSNDDNMYLVRYGLSVSVDTVVDLSPWFIN